MYIAIRTTGVPIEIINKFLTSEGCSEIIMNTEQPQDVELHNHWLCKINKELASFKKQRTRILKDYKGNQFVSIQALKKTKEEYLRYMCKGYNVTKPYSSYVNNCEAPQVIGIEESEVLENHNEFWKTYECMKVKDVNKYKTKTVGEKFLEYALPYCLENGIEGSNATQIFRVTVRYFGKIAKTKFGANLIVEYMNLLTINLREELITGEMCHSNFENKVMDLYYCKSNF